MPVPLQVSGESAWHRKLHNFSIVKLSSCTGAHGQYLRLLPPRRPPPKNDAKISKGPHHRLQKVLSNWSYFALVSIAECVICDGELLELLLGTFVLVLVGVVLQRELAVRTLDVIFRGSGRDAEQVVEFGLLHHLCFMLLVLVEMRLVRAKCFSILKGFVVDQMIMS